MGTYFYGYIEWKDDEWKLHLLKRPDNPGKPATYVVQGHVRDLISSGDLGSPVRMKKDPSYTPPPPRKEYGLTFTSPDRMLVNDDLSDEMTGIINKEFDPEQKDESGWICTHTYFKILIGDFISKADEERVDAIRRIKEFENDRNRKDICKRLDSIETFMKFISEGKSVKGFKNIGAMPEEEADDDEDSYYEEDSNYYEEDVLQYDIYALHAAAGFLGGIAEILGDFGADSDKVRFIACLD